MQLRIPIRPYPPTARILAPLPGTALHNFQQPPPGGRRPCRPRPAYRRRRDQVIGLRTVFARARQQQMNLASALADAHYFKPRQGFASTPAFRAISSRPNGVDLVGVGLTQRGIHSSARRTYAGGWTMTNKKTPRQANATELIHREVESLALLLELISILKATGVAGTIGRRKGRPGSY